MKDTFFKIGTPYVETTRSKILSSYIRKTKNVTDTSRSSKIGKEKRNSFYLDILSKKEEKIKEKN